MDIIIALAIAIALVALSAQGVQTGNDVDGLVAKKAAILTAIHKNG